MNSSQKKFLFEKVLMVGLGRSGIAACEALSQLGVQVRAIDSDSSSISVDTKTKLEQKGISVSLGNNSLSVLEEIDLVVVSPGVPNSIPLLVEAKRKNLPIWSEVELAYNLSEFKKIVGITGTNGKTTTTILVGEIFKMAGYPSIVAGNIGSPIVQYLGEARGKNLIVELSSFQLANIHKFRPAIGALLNISEDHLNWHQDLEEYIWAKSRLFLNQTKEDWAIINYDDEIARKISRNLKSRVVFFSKSCQGSPGVYLEEDKIKIGFLGYKSKDLCSLNELKLKGKHNVENFMAATAIALIAKVSWEVVREAIINFRGIEHRLEYVEKISGVKFFNDSKATNPAATIRALEAFYEPVILLAGGRNKGNSFLKLAREIKKKAKALVLFGEAASEIREALGNNNSVKVTEADSLKEAVKLSLGLAKPGDVVLLSPACASFDMFTNYEERGEEFKKVLRSG